MYGKYPPRMPLTKLYIIIAPGFFIFVPMMKYTTPSRSEKNMGISTIVIGRAYRNELMKNITTLMRAKSVTVIMSLTFNFDVFIIKSSKNYIGNLV